MESPQKDMRLRNGKEKTQETSQVLAFDNTKDYISESTYIQSPQGLVEYSIA
jgi:hypothetical protein